MVSLFYRATFSSTQRLAQALLKMNMKLLRGLELVCDSDMSNKESKCFEALEKL